MASLQELGAAIAAQPAPPRVRVGQVVTLGEQRREVLVAVGARRERGGGRHRSPVPRVRAHQAACWRPKLSSSRRAAIIQ